MIAKTNRAIDPNNNLNKDKCSGEYASKPTLIPGNADAHRVTTTICANSIFKFILFSITIPPPK